MKLRIEKRLVMVYDIDTMQDNWHPTWGVVVDDRFYMTWCWDAAMRGEVRKDWALVKSTIRQSDLRVGHTIVVEAFPDTSDVYTVISL